MKYLGKLICLSMALALCGCSRISGWIHKQDMASEANFAANEVTEPAHPMGATYNVESTAGPHKQLSLFFDGQGKARVLELGVGRDKKTIVDYTSQIITTKDFNTNWQDAKAIDPFSFPSVIDAKQAKLQKALCLGAGASKGFPYHRWCVRKNANEFEVWTDDKENFPIYFRAIKNGEVTTWTEVSAWVDGSTYDRKTFFTLEADPPPPEPIKTAEQIEQEEFAREKKTHKHHGNTHKHGVSKKEHKEATG